MGLIYLAIRRRLHDEYNLLNVGKPPDGVRFNPADFPFRTADGKFNDPFDEGAGSEGTFFGRNMPPVDQKDKVPCRLARIFVVKLFISLKSSVYIEIEDKRTTSCTDNPLLNRKLSRLKITFMILG